MKFLQGVVGLHTGTPPVQCLTITPRIRALLATGSVPIVIVYLMVISMAVYGRKSWNFFFEFLWPNLMQDTEFFY